MKKHPTLERAGKLAEMHGSTAETAKGILSFLQKKGVKSGFFPKSKPVDPVLYSLSRKLRTAKKGDSFGDLPTVPIPGFPRSAVANQSAEDSAVNQVAKNNPRKKNLYRGSARRGGAAVQERWDTINYKGSYKGWTGSEVHADYQSCVTFRPGLALVIAGNVVLRRILAPAGMVFKGDSSGVFLERKTDGMDYHPTPEEWLSNRFASVVRENMAENYQRRVEANRAEREAKKDAKEAARIDAIFQRDIPTTRVTLSDSRRAGNCVEGTLAFCERKLGIPREDVLRGAHLFAVPADRVLRFANGQTDQAMRAVKAAWMRETMVQI